MLKANEEKEWGRWNFTLVEMQLVAIHVFST
jgi:hypothetical protein